MATKFLRGGKAFTRWILSIEDAWGIQLATQTAKAAVGDRGTDSDLNGENVCFRSLASAENVGRVLVGAGLDPARIPTIAAHLRTGTSARWNPAKDGVTKDALKAHLVATGYRKG